MPIYPVTLTVPADTAEDAPVEVDVQIKERVVTRVDVKFKPGCMDMVHVAVFYGIKQLFPRETGKSVVGDAETVSWLEWWEAPEVPCTITFKAWSPGTEYQHQLVCRIMTLPERTERVERLAKNFYQAALRFLEEIVGLPF